jgi:outer membrane immunogenic protein
MKNLTTAIVAIALIGTPAFAADIPVKAAAPSPVAVYNWTGWYAGVNAGASFGSVKTDFNGAPFLWAGVFGPIAPGFGFSDRASPDGFMGGGQIGYNWQWSPLIVLGLEADFQGAAEKDNITLTNAFTSFPSANTTVGTAVIDYTTKIEWFGTVRARIGYVWGNGKVLSYVTGGLAYGKVDLEGTSNVSGGFVGFCCSPFSNTQAFGHSQVNTGWVVGYGTEGVLAIPGWTWKVEGLYMDLGTLNTTSVTTSNPLINANPNFGTGAQVTTHSHFTDGILRGGLNYKFY